MKKVITITTVVLIVGLALLIAMPSAHAMKPLDVDCYVLEATIIEVDNYLDNVANIQYKSVGELFSAAIIDPVTFTALDGLILLYSDGTINFESAAQAIATISKCGLMPLLIEEVAD